MPAVSVSELKSRLSHYLRMVKRGGEVQVLDRGVPVARLVGIDSGGDDDLRARLIASGSVRAGSGDPAAVLRWPPVVADASVLEALLEDREEGF